MAPTVPVVGVEDTMYCKPPASLPAVPVPSEKRSLLIFCCIVFLRFSILPASRSNFPAAPIVTCFSNSDITMSPPANFQAYS